MNSVQNPAAFGAGMEARFAAAEVAVCTPASRILRILPPDPYLTVPAPPPELSALGNRGRARFGRTVNGPPRPQIAGFQGARPPG